MPADPQATSATSDIPEKLGKYRLIKLLGRGSTSRVFLAHDSFRNIEVAIKLTHANIFDDSTSELARAGFEAEAALIGRLNHPHVARIYDVVHEDDMHYIVMEYVGGGTLEKFCVPGTLLDHETVVDTIFKCGKALQYMESQGLIHRDIKPANILITDNADIKLTDFGATMAKAQPTATTPDIGTPAYMSPEQLSETPLDFRSDMYSLGVVLYQLLTGSKPFQGTNTASLVYQIMSREPDLPSKLVPGTPAELDTIVSRMMRKKPAERYPTWAACLDDLITLTAHTRSAAAASVSISSTSEQFSLMRQCSFFRAFSDADLWYVLEIAKFNRVVEGDVLIREGDVGEFFLVLLKGQIRVSKTGRLLDVLSEGVSLGEISYIQESRIPRNTTCVALTDGVVMRINDEDLRKASAICRSRFERTFLRTLSAWLVDANNRLALTT